MSHVACRVSFPPLCGNAVWPHCRIVAGWAVLVALLRAGQFWWRCCGLGSFGGVAAAHQGGHPGGADVRGIEGVERLSQARRRAAPARLGWEWLWSTPWPEIPERPLPAGSAKFRLRGVPRRRVCATPPRFHRQSGGLGADEAQPQRNSESARDSQSDHDSCGRQKPEVPIRNRTGRPPGRSSWLNFSHRPRSAGCWPPRRRARVDRARGGPGRAQARERKESDTPASAIGRSRST